MPMQCVCHFGKLKQNSMRAGESVSHALPGMHGNLVTGVVRGPLQRLTSSDCGGLYQALSVISVKPAAAGIMIEPQCLTRLAPWLCRSAPWAVSL